MQYMYHIFLLLSISFVLCKTGGAQTPIKNDSAFKVFKNVISTDPLFLGFGIVNLNYERAVSKELHCTRERPMSTGTTIKVMIF
jgi:hypothetical protein